jgi:hypothetical protein
MEVNKIANAGQKITEIIKRLNIGINGYCSKGEELLDTDTLMRDVAFQKALLLIPAIFEPSGRKGICSYSLKHRIERMVPNYISNAQTVVAFAFLGYDISRCRDSINYNIKCRMLQLDKENSSQTQDNLGRAFQKIYKKFPVEQDLHITDDFSIFNEIPTIRIYF